MWSDNYTRTKQLESLYDHLPTIIAAIMLTVSVIGATLVFHFSPKDVILWVLFMWAVCSIRWISLKWMRKEGYEIKGVQFWLITFLILSALSGLGTGFLVYFFLDANNFLYSIFILMTYVGYLSAGILSNSCLMYAYFSYSLPATIMVLLRLLTDNSNEEIYTTLAIMFVFYYVLMTIFAKNANSIFMGRIQWNQERDSLVDELRQQKETAEQAVKAKNKFLASASHDLRQPLHALGLFHDTLRHRINKPESLEIMDKISKSTQALNDLLHSMLDISKLDASVVENSPSDIHLNTVLRPIYSEFSERAKEKNLRFYMNIDDSLYVHVDAILFERVVRNLIDNAIKYTEKGVIDVVAYRVNDSVDVCIADTGIGIPQDQLENVFSEFNQLGNPERDKQKGLGLGLSIVKRLCELMELDIDFKSTLDKGTEVTLNIPSSDSTVEVSSNYSDPISIRESIVLIIEDDVAILDGMSLLLETFGFNVLKAITTKQAMSSSSEVKPDLIIADYRLPGKEDGLELIDAVRAYHLQHIPAILVTGDTAPDRIKITNSADVLVLHKPVSPALLEETIEKILS